MTKIQAVVLWVSLVAPTLAEAQPAFRWYKNLSPQRTPEARPLFQATPPPTPAARAATTPRVVCGMTVLTGDAAIDPGIVARITPPAARPAVRPVDPPICVEPERR